QQKPQQGGQWNPMKLLMGLQAGLKREDIEALANANTLGMPEVARTIEQADSMGRPQTAQMDKFGRPVGSPVAKPYQTNLEDFGDYKQRYDAYTGGLTGNHLPKADMNQLIVPGADGKPTVNQALLNAKRQVAAAGATKIDL